MFNNRGNSNNPINMLDPHIQLYAQQLRQQLNQRQTSQTMNNNNINRGSNGQNQNRPRPQQQQQQQQNVNNNVNRAQQQRPNSQQQQQRPNSQQQQQRPNQNNNNNNNNNSNNNTNNHQQQQTRPNQNSQQPQAPPPPPVLPKGWKKEEIVRQRGIRSGLAEIVYTPPPNNEQTTDLTGRKFRSKIELQRHVGDKYDMALLDWKTGKISQAVWRKQRRMKSIAANPNNFASACKYDPYLNVPVRQLASVFKQSSVCCVTNNHRNEPTPAHLLNQPNQNNNQNNNNNNNKPEKPKPIQLFWELRFNSLRAVDPKLDDIADIKQDLELENIPKLKNFDITNESGFRSVAAACYLNPNKIMVGQDKEFSKNARVFMDREQPLIAATTVKEEEIKQQEAKLKEMRKQLQMALSEYENFDLNIIGNNKIELSVDEEEEQPTNGTDHKKTANNECSDVEVIS